jgi:putative glycosyltransferase
MYLSIVSTLYNSASYLEEFYTRMTAAAERITDDYEIILVNDGSPDDSLDLAISLYEKDDRVRLIDLSRNFGHHKTMMTGLAHARGSLVFLIDCDLEEEPELLNEFHQQIKASGADVVYGFQQKRKGKFFERITGEIFYKLLNVLSNHPVPANLLTVRLMTQRYVASLIQHMDRELWLAGLYVITGFKQVPVPVRKHSKGSSAYTLRRKVSELVSAITASSSKPLVFIFYLGCAIVIISSTAAALLVVRRIFFGALLAGWPSLIVSVWLLGGLILFCLGIIGIYLSKIFMETKRRPYTVVRQIYDRAGESGNELERHPGKRGTVLYGESQDVWPHA